MKKKRAAAHLEMIIAFVFFIGFVTFIFMVVKPYPESPLTGASIASIEQNFKEATKTTLSEVFIKVTQDQNPCYSINLQGKLQYPLIENTPQSKTRTLPSNTFKDSMIEGENLKLGSGTGSFKTLISPEFESTNPNGCTPLNPPDYKIGSIYEHELVSFKSLDSLKNQYYNNYQDVKNLLNIPSNVDFTIRFPDINSPNIDMVPLPTSDIQLPSDSDMYTETFLIEVLNDKGEITNTRAVVSLW